MCQRTEKCDKKICKSIKSLKVKMYIYDCNKTKNYQILKRFLLLFIFQYQAPSFLYWAFDFYLFFYSFYNLFLSSDLSATELFSWLSICYWISDYLIHLPLFEARPFEYKWSKMQFTSLINHTFISNHSSESIYITC